MTLFYTFVKFLLSGLTEDLSIFTSALRSVGCIMLFYVKGKKYTEKGGAQLFQTSADILLFLPQDLTSRTFIKVSCNVASVNSPSLHFVTLKAVGLS